MNSISRTLSSISDHLTYILSSKKNLLIQKELMQIHAQILTNGLLISSTPLFTDFLSSCYHCQNPEYATHILQSFSKPAPNLWNTIIRVSLEARSFKDFVKFYNGLRSFNFVPSKSTVSLILRRCVGSNGIQLGKSFQCQIMILGFEFDMVLQTRLLDFYAKIGDLESAKKMFAEMPERDVVANNTMIAAFSKFGYVEQVKELFYSMPERDTCSWNSVISCCCKVGNITLARLIFDQSPKKDVISWNAMIDGYCKSGQLMNAGELFMVMGTSKNAVTWNTMIAGYVQSRDFERAINLFRRMQDENVKPTEVTMVNLLSACAHLVALDMGEWIHNYIKRNGIKVDVILGNALIDMYSKCGNVGASLSVFHGLEVKNIFCWNSIIIALGMHGYGQEAIDAFVSMKKDGIKPDWITFIGLLSACSHSGLVSEGRSYFSQIHSVYGVEPTIEHYGCMVDLLGRSGCLEEALEFVKSMPIKPNSAVWGSLLRACQIHKETKTAEKVSKHLLELDPKDGGNYVSLSNLYASLNNWNSVNIFRNLMMEKGVHKTPGCSSMEINNVIHEFVAGDTSHPQYQEIYAFLDTIFNEIQAHGYEPDTTSVLHDIEDEEKESVVRCHSERIAIAFGLMNTPPGKTIRVVKNLRTCNDCHVAIKITSKVFKREIILRDRNRFHHFKEGICSCKDSW